MATAAGTRPRGAGRAQLHEVALRLFARDGVEGTSLQDIADEMGVSKAALYYHYKTKEELVLGVIAPLLDQLAEIVAGARQHRARQARIDAVITGLVRLVLDSHSWFIGFMVDPYVVRLLPEQVALRRSWEELVELVTGADRDDFLRVALLVFVTGLPGSLREPHVANLDQAQLQDHLVECGRRLLQARRRPTHAG
jgi:AcrR family transcriptional regulator